MHGIATTTYADHACDLQLDRTKEFVWLCNCDLADICTLFSLQHARSFDCISRCIGWNGDDVRSGLVGGGNSWEIWVFWGAGGKEERDVNVRTKTRANNCFVETQVFCMAVQLQLYARNPCDLQLDRTKEFAWLCNCVLADAEAQGKQMLREDPGVCVALPLQLYARYPCDLQSDRTKEFAWLCDCDVGYSCMLLRLQISRSRDRTSRCIGRGGDEEVI